MDRIGAPYTVLLSICGVSSIALVYLGAHRRIHNGVQQGWQFRLLFYLCYTMGVILIASWLLGHLHAMLRGVLGNPALVTLAAKILITPPQLFCNFIVSRLVARTRFRKGYA